MTFPSAVPIGGYISGGGGTIPVLGGVTNEITGDANLTLTLEEADPFFQQITSDGSITTTLEVVVPLIAGKTWLFQNATTEGHAFTVIGTSGTGVTVNAGSVALVMTDGVNVYSSSGSGFPSEPFSVTFNPSGTTGGTTFSTWAALQTYVTGVLTALGYATPYTVYFYPGSSAIIPASVSLPGEFITWASVPFFDGIDISVGAGFTMPNVVQWTVIGCNVIDNTTNNWKSSGSVAVILDNATILTTASSGASAIFGTGAGYTLQMFNQSSISANHTKGLFDGTVNPCFISGGSAAGPFTIIPSGTSDVILIGDSSFSPYSLYAGSFVIYLDASSTTSSGVTLHLLDQASAVAYTPATPGNWSPVPSKVNAALDTLAASISSDGVTWADDLASSTATAQYVSAISGTNGTSGTVLLGGNGASDFHLQMVPASAPTAPSLSIVSAEGFSGTSGSAAGQFNFVGGAGGTATGADNTGGTGAPLIFVAGQGGPSTGTAVNAAGGPINFYTGIPSAGGSGGLPAPAPFTVSISGDANCVRLGSAATDYIAFDAGAVTAQSGFLRFPSNSPTSIITIRNPAGSGDISILSALSSGGDQNLLLGSGSLETFYLVTGAEFSAQTSSGQWIDIQGATTDFLALAGPNNAGGVAQSGYLRFPALTGATGNLVTVRNQGGTADVSVLEAFNLGGQLRVNLGGGGTSASNAGYTSLYGSVQTAAIGPVFKIQAATPVVTWNNQTAQGTIASQNGNVYEDAGVASIPATTTVSVYSSATIPQACSGLLKARVVARATATAGGVTLGDTYTTEVNVAFKRITGGNVSQIQLTQVSVGSDASLSSLVGVGLEAGQTNLVLRVDNSSGAPLDCTAVVSFILN